jgi:ribose transport system permease protein
MSAPANAAAPRRLGLSRDGLQIVYRLAAIILIGLVLMMFNPAFLTTSNILNVLRQSSLLFFMASGLTLVILTGQIDLSIGANVGLSACLAATVIKATNSPWLGSLAGLGVGSLVGLVNGLVITRLRLPSFIATYGMLWVGNGLTYYYMGGQTIDGFPPGFRALGSGYWLGAPIPVYLMAAFLIVGAFFAQRTIWGQQLCFIGANPAVARLSGVPVERRLMLVFIVSGAMAGLASLIFLARLNSAEGDIGEALTLPAVAAVAIGGASLFGGTGTLTGTLLGAIILTLFLNGMNLLLIDANWQPLVTGVAMVAAVWLDMTTTERGLWRRN